MPRKSGRHEKWGYTNTRSYSDRDSLEIGGSAEASIYHDEENYDSEEETVDFGYGRAGAKAGIDYGAKAKAEVGVKSVKARSGPVTVKSKALTYGGKASVDPYRLKAEGELKATLAETKAKCGPVTATVGISATTGGSISLERTGFKVAGTGGYVDTSGFEVSVLGSGFKVNFKDLFD